MTKAEIANMIACDGYLTQGEAIKVIEAFMNVVKESLAKGENVYLRGFGSFIVKRRAEKPARDILKNKQVIIPAHNIPAFKPADIFKEQVAEGK